LPFVHDRYGLLASDLYPRMRDDIRMNSEQMSDKVPTIVSLFCGAGGLDLGFAKAGFHTVWANDCNADACETFRRWSDAEVICGDISVIDPMDIPDADILLGGFPCQGFSLAGYRRLDDSRNKLYREYVRIVKAKRPLAFVGENVQGLLTMAGGAVMDAIVSDFAACGYDVQYRLLNAKDYGVPEDRKRVIIVGLRSNLGLTFVYPKPNAKRVTMREALAGVPAPKPEDVIEASYSSRYMSRNRRRDWDQQSFTIMAMAKQMPLWPGSPDMIEVGPDRWTFGEGETRRLSWQEAAAIQTFPHDMEFCGNLESKCRQIGNAVPPELAYRVAVELRKTLTNI